MGLLTYISYVAVIAAFAFVTLSLASGLLYVSELIEEHSRLAKVYGQRGIFAIIALHVILYFSESLPLAHTAFSIICHIVYLQNFSASWPLISLTSISFIASCLLVIADHFLWFFHFAHITQEARHRRTYRGPPPEAPPGFTEIASFFGICVWLAPLFLFLSLSANDNALPVSAAEPGSPSGSSSMQYAQTRVSLFRSLFSLDSLPHLRPKGSRRNTDGLLAPHSPNPARTSTFPPATPTTSRYMPPPPRSPGPGRVAEADGRLTPSQSFTLDPPPRRSTPARRHEGAVGDTSGLGLRRIPSSTVVDKDS
ncbi:putative inositol polyphosphate phosphatase, catalytic domain homologues [Lyophyllum shimeji]|uniref:Inositol polyphosphate phosphatase, catalytic domain homologues n=1 Tax=Lyophyllum shimeji TaxID=47721 RepID=A0A9P3UK22_LYOSH|nr:putative inositol polyphosphate phosphatase, catalytic domain homologues [Lyophyllum shimeji]